MTADQRARTAQVVHFASPAHPEDIIGDLRVLRSAYTPEPSRGAVHLAEDVPTQTLLTLWEGLAYWSDLTEHESRLVADLKQALALHGIEVGER